MDKDAIKLVTLRNDLAGWLRKNGMKILSAFAQPGSMLSFSSIPQGVIIKDSLPGRRHFKRRRVAVLN